MAVHSSGLTHELQREAGFVQNFTITLAQGRLLRDHAAIVRALEDIYSWRQVYFALGQRLSTHSVKREQPEL